MRAYAFEATVVGTLDTSVSPVCQEHVSLIPQLMSLRAVAWASPIREMGGRAWGKFVSHRHLLASSSCSAIMTLSRFDNSKLWSVLGIANATVSRRLGLRHGQHLNRFPDMTSPIWNGRGSASRPLGIGPG
jgi:hypothetical protein